MKNLLFSISMIISVIATAQRPTEIQVRAGYGLAVYKTSTTLSYNDGLIEITQDTTDGGVTAHVPVEIRYEITDRFNAGLDMKFGRYLYAPEDKISGRSNRFSIIGIGLEGVLFNASDTRMYLGVGFNTGKLVITEEKIDWWYGSYSETVTLQGAGFRFNFGVCHFIKDGPVAINLNIGYDQHDFKLKTIERDNASQDLTNFSGSLKVGGIEAMAGLIFRIRT